ncbi:hypothetical protein [Longimicrobium sp.]|uniref:hypothetical protein n=1 Tax=Longimicrobium sp. TaxID=2029185 RepID=UPI003B3BB280
MRKLILNAVMAVICAVGAPSAADAQSRRAVPELAPPQAVASTPVVAPAHAGLGAAAEVRQDFFSAAALGTFRTPRRHPLLMPAVGALVGAAGVTGLIFHACSNTDCILDPVTPVVAGAAAGAVVGGVIELGLRVAGR